MSPIRTDPDKGDDPPLFNRRAHSIYIACKIFRVISFLLFAFFVAFFAAFFVYCFVVVRA